MLWNLILLLSCLYISAPAFGQNRRIQQPKGAARNQRFSKPSRFYKNIYFNLGNHTSFYNAVQKDDSGGLRKFAFAPTVGAGLTIPLSGRFNFLPEFNWVLPQFSEDSHIITNIFMYRADLGFDLIKNLRFRLGTGIMHQNQHGRGGSTTERNGNGTSSFYYPEENRSSLNNTLDLGVEVLFEQFSLRFQTYTYSVFLADKRQLSYTLFATYYWDR